jgi:hypothetical protein
MKSQLFCPEIFLDMRYKSTKNKELRLRHVISPGPHFADWPGETHNCRLFWNGSVNL